MSKAQRYYGLYKLVSETVPPNATYQNGIISMASGAAIMNNNKVVLEPYCDTAFKSKKEAIAELEKGEVPAMVTILEFYLILEK